MEFFLIILAIGSAVLYTPILVNINPRTVLFVHIFFRFILDSFPEYTYRSIISSFSIMDIYSILFICYSFIYLTDKKYLKIDWLFKIFFLYIFMNMVSSIYNGTLLYFMTFLLKMLYLWLLINFVKIVALKNGPQYVCLICLLCVIYPFGNLVYSMITGNKVFLAGIYRYIGTYNHQSIISSILFFSVPACLYLLVTEKKSNKIKLCYFVALIALSSAIFVVSYRTTWFVLIVFVFVYFLFQIRKNNFKTKLYVSIFVTSCVFLIFSTTVLNPILNRIDPVFILLKDPLGYFQFSSDPNMIQYNQLFSGRLNLWNTGLSEYSSSSFINKLIGLGPGNFNNLMKKYMNTEAYAHNEFISSIVETGVLGFFSFIVWIGAFFYQIKLRSRPSDYFYHIAIAFFIAFFVNALGTMPFRSIRHLMTFGVYVGVILSFPVLSNNNQKISSIKERK